MKEKVTRAAKAGPNKKDNSVRINVLDVCRGLLVGGKKVGSEWHCGSLHGGSGDKCRVHLSSGHWSYWPADKTDRYFIKSDLMKRKSGSKIIELVMAATGLSREDAAKYLQRFKK